LDVALPFPTRLSYLRAVETDGLEPFVHGSCGLCGRPLWANGWGFRKFQGLRLRRALCSGCETSFTFLPTFLAPAKWYDYPSILNASEFLAQPRFSTATAAITEWDLARSVDRDNHRRRRPSAPTVWRWWASLGRAAESEWLALTVSQVSQRAPDHPLPFREGDLISSHHRAKAMLRTLVVLGGLIKYALEELKGACTLALGLWCVESIRRQRVLEPPCCARKGAPGPSPRVEFRGDEPGLYPAGPSPPQGTARRFDGVPSR
jgi:hypothetical protein